MKMLGRRLDGQENGGGALEAGEERSKEGTTVLSAAGTTWD